ncbi:hypothetical protein [Jiella marina]|uniref:hypothetical protein n=1 Tax=Jiella sp. LLJ827 TaxID=2917712 RepID=UPI002100FAD0|nr:hypothetical protein [Jiella sp. LLJ827]MCQ0990345.1 hypothetical protein [Jiella sp. LLJ827]
MFRIDVPAHLTGTDRCIMPICGCIDAMHGRAFKELVQATASRFRSVRLILCDTLDAHNFALRDDPLWDEAVETCRASAARWLRKSRPILDAAFDHVAVTVWNDLKTPEFDRIERRVRGLYQGNPAVKAYIDGICSDYTERAATRQEAQGFTPDRDKIFARSLNYTLEEIPGTVIYQRLFRAPVIYVGSYFDDPQFFNRHSGDDMDLTLPEWCRVHDITDGRTMAA